MIKPSDQEIIYFKLRQISWSRTVPLFSPPFSGGEICVNSCNIATHTIFLKSDRGWFPPLPCVLGGDIEKFCHMVGEISPPPPLKFSYGQTWICYLVVENLSFLLRFLGTMNIEGEEEDRSTEDDREAGGRKTDSDYKTNSSEADSFEAERANQVFVTLMRAECRRCESDGMLCVLLHSTINCNNHHKQAVRNWDN